MWQSALKCYALTIKRGMNMTERYLRILTIFHDYINLKGIVMSILGIAITTILGLLGIAAIIIGFFGGETYLVIVGILLLVSGALTLSMFKKRLSNPFKD